MFIRPATLNDIPAISQLANRIWWPAYTNVIPPEQIEFMLGDMYSEEALQLQMAEGICFLIVERGSTPVAFAAYSLIIPEEQVFKLQKLYVLPAEQGKGMGKVLIAEVAKLAKALGGKILELNVNRKNPAFSFYQKLGFEVYLEVDIPYHRFVLNDYLMRQDL